MPTPLALVGFGWTSEPGLAPFLLARRPFFYFLVGRLSRQNAHPLSLFERNPRMTNHPGRLAQRQHSTSSRVEAIQSRRNIQGTRPVVGASVRDPRGSPNPHPSGRPQLRCPARAQAHETSPGAASCPAPPGVRGARCNLDKARPSPCITVRPPSRDLILLRTRFDPIEYNPKAWLAYSTERVLTLEYLDGIPVSVILTDLRRDRGECLARHALMQAEGCDLDQRLEYLVRTAAIRQRRLRVRAPAKITAGSDGVCSGCGPLGIRPRRIGPRPSHPAAWRHRLALICHQQYRGEPAAPATPSHSPDSGPREP